MSHFILSIRENKTANAFFVKISRNETISDLKEIIKVKKQKDFAGVDADKLKLWKVKIPYNRDLLGNLTLQDK